LQGLSSSVTKKLGAEILQREAAEKKLEVHPGQAGEDRLKD